MCQNSNVIRGQITGPWFSSSTLWVSRIELRLSGFQKMPLPTAPSCQPFENNKYQSNDKTEKSSCRLPEDVQGKGWLSKVCRVSVSELMRTGEENVPPLSGQELVGEDEKGLCFCVSMVYVLFLGKQRGRQIALLGPVFSLIVHHFWSRCVLVSFPRKTR